MNQLLGRPANRPACIDCDAFVGAEHVRATDIESVVSTRSLGYRPNVFDPTLPTKPRHAGRGGMTLSG
jgi:hypothetical protein